jgi:hypothetical protein
LTDFLFLLPALPRDLCLRLGEDECLRDENDSRVDADGFKTLDGESKKMDFSDVEVDDDADDDVAAAADRFAPVADD